MTPSPAIVLGGGCFWCVEAVYQLVPGVTKVVSGYAGGTRPNPSYEEVCSGETGHAEVIRIEFDPAKINARRLYDLFWDAHDPTTLNRQGADVGTQYRSIILADDDAQLADAEASKTAAQPRFKRPIVTEIAALKDFWPAERAHQDYFANNPGNPYSAAVIRPKVEKFKKSLAQPAAD